MHDIDEMSANSLEEKKIYPSTVNSTIEIR